MHALFLACMYCAFCLLVQVLEEAEPRNTLFTGSQRVAERLAVQLKGKVRLGLDCGVLAA